jgi:hypothetical protein
MSAAAITPRQFVVATAAAGGRRPAATRRPANAYAPLRCSVDGRLELDPVL